MNTKELSTITIPFPTPKPCWPTVSSMTPVEGVYVASVAVNVLLAPAVPTSTVIVSAPTATIGIDLSAA